MGTYTPRDCHGDALALWYSADSYPVFIHMYVRIIVDNALYLIPIYRVVNAQWRSYVAVQMGTLK